MDLRSKLEYTQTGLRTYLVILAWDLLFHSPGDVGWFYCFFRLEITLFHLPQALGGARAVISKVTEARALEPSHILGPGFREF